MDKNFIAALRRLQPGDVIHFPEIPHFATVLAKNGELLELSITYARKNVIRAATNPFRVDEEKGLVDKAGKAMPHLSDQCSIGKEEYPELPGLYLEVPKADALPRRWTGAYSEEILKKYHKLLPVVEALVASDDILSAEKVWLTTDYLKKKGLSEEELCVVMGSILNAVATAAKKIAEVHILVPVSEEIAAGLKRNEPEKPSVH